MADGKGLMVHRPSTISHQPSAISHDSVSPPYHEKRNDSCVIRMNPPCEVIWPKLLLPRVSDENPANCGRLNRLNTSTLNCPCLEPPSGMFFCAAMSVLMILGVRASSSVRGAFPHVPAGAAEKAAVV